MSSPTFAVFTIVCPEVKLNTLASLDFNRLFTFVPVLADSQLRTQAIALLPSLYPIPSEGAEGWSEAHCRLAQQAPAFHGSPYFSKDTFHLVSRNPPTQGLSSPLIIEHAFHCKNISEHSSTRESTSVVLQFFIFPLLSTSNSEMAATVMRKGDRCKAHAQYSVTGLRQLGCGQVAVLLSRRKF